MDSKQDSNISIKAWIGIGIGTFLIGAIIFAQFEDPGGIALVISFVIGFVVSLLGWSLLSLGYQAGSGK